MKTINKSDLLSNTGASPVGAPPYFFIWALILLCWVPFLHAEYSVCYVGTTGLTKTDFTISLTNTDTCAALTTTAITVTECPASSGLYKFDALTYASGTNYRLEAIYDGAVVCDVRYPSGGSAFNVTWQNSFSYTVNSNVFKQGDISPTISLTVPGFATDCTPVGWSAKYTMWNSRTNGVKVDDAAALVTCTASGSTYTLVFSYTLTATNTNMSDCQATDTICKYLAEFTLYNPAAQQVQTFPPNDSLQVQIVRKR